MFSIALAVLPGVMAAAALLYAPTLLALWIQKRRLPLIRHAVRYTFVCTAVMILYATVFWYGFRLDFHAPYRNLNLAPLDWLFSPYEMGLSRTVEQLLVNILMFVPLGALLPAVFPALRRFVRTAMLCLLITLSIETLQYFTGRSADIDDLLLNATGGALGYGLYALLHTLLRGSPRFCAALALPPTDAASGKPHAMTDETEADI